MRDALVLDALVLDAIVICICIWGALLGWLVIEWAQAAIAARHGRKSRHIGRRE